MDELDAVAESGHPQSPWATDLCLESPPSFDGGGRAQVIPMLGREVVEGQQRVAVLGEAFDHPAVLGAVFLGED